MSKSSQKASCMLTTRLAQIGQQFVGNTNCKHTRARIRQAVVDELRELERLIGQATPFPNVSRVRKIIQARIDGHSN